MVNAVTNNSAISDITSQVKNVAQPKSNELGQDAFLQLMITQMNNQNPLEPQSNSEFVAQLAQFSSVEGLEKLNTTTAAMAASNQSSQALQASSMVGRTVKVSSDVAQFNGSKSIEGTAELPFSTSSLQMNVYSSAGVLVGQQALGAKAAGDFNFTWDGKSADGQTLPADSYRFEVLATQGNGETKQIGTALSANVDSVTLGNNGTITLNVAGIGPVSMSGVKEIF